MPEMCTVTLSDPPAGYSIGSAWSGSSAGPGGIAPSGIVKVVKAPSRKPMIESGFHRPQGPVAGDDTGSTSAIIAAAGRPRRAVEAGDSRRRGVDSRLLCVSVRYRGMQHPGGAVRGDDDRPRVAEQSVVGGECRPRRSVEPPDAIGRSTRIGVFGWSPRGGRPDPHRSVVGDLDVRREPRNTVVLVVDGPPVTVVTCHTGPRFEDRPDCSIGCQSERSGPWVGGAIPRSLDHDCIGAVVLDQVLAPDGKQHVSVRSNLERTDVAAPLGELVQLGEVFD